MTERTDIFISGGGIAGLAAAAAFGKAGFAVHLADPVSPVDAPEETGSDLRSTAFLQPSRALLERAGLWEHLDSAATPLRTLQVVDTQGWPPVERARRAFRSSELGEAPFGWNLPNWLTRKVLIDAVEVMDSVTIHLGVGFAELLMREREALVGLTDGTRLRARLAIAADGHASPLREAAGIGARTTRYGQKAIAFAAAHDFPHEDVSTELYNRGGAFVMVPMRDHGGRPASSVVWMLDGPDAARLMATDDATFGAEATERSLHELGKLTPISPRRLWPVVTQVADRLTAQRVALIAEAAHVMPPIGAQGLNTSLHDVAVLLDLAEARPDELGNRQMLDAYDAARMGDIRRRAAAIDLYNRVCKSGASPVQALRTLGLRLAHDMAPIRRGLMDAGLGR